jgi:pyruvate dehydrogenase E1 component alpha subunit
VAIAYFGDGASSQGDIHEAMNTAGVSQLPVIFFCQNNGWAISVPTSEQVAGGSVAARAAGYGMPGVRVDGNDVLAVYDATVEALDRARNGGGPTVIEAMTYRMGPHSTSDDPGRYRTLDEEQSWLARDPLALCEEQLRRTGTVGDAFFAEVADTAAALAERVRDEVAALGGRPGEEMFDFVFADPPASLLGQRRAWEESRLG